MKTEVRTFLIDKVMMINIASIGLSFTDIEMGLRIIALGASIIYTILKIKDRSEK